MIKFNKILETRHGKVMGTFVVAVPSCYKPFVSCRLNSEGKPFNAEYFDTEKEALHNMNERARILDARFGE